MDGMLARLPTGIDAVDAGVRQGYASRFAGAPGICAKLAPPGAALSICC
jgi:hypothetical protein